MRYIKGEEKLTALFGKWPSFHDAEVWSLIHERTEEGFAVVAVVHAFEMTPEVDARGNYKLVKHTRVTLRFTDCEDVHFDGFQHQNVLFALAVSEEELRDAKRPFTVRFESSFGLEGRLKCRAIEVADACPWIPPHGIYAEN